MTGMVAPRRAFAQHDPRRAQARLLIAVIAGVATEMVIPARFDLAMRAVAGWTGFALTLGCLAWWLIARASVAETRRRAAADDPGRQAVRAIVIVASGFSLFATAVVLREARTRPPDVRALFVALCIVAVASAWMLTQTAYTLHYAHLYYRDDGDGEGGLVFPGDEAPDYLDFAYLAFTVGMCFQVSDVCVSSRLIRRAILGHAVLSFAYNTVILATAINLVVGIVG